MMGEREAAKTALTEALQRRSSSFEALVALGTVYLQEKNFGRAASVLRKAAAIRSDDASIFYALALAEEGRYQFAAAQKAYSQAVNLKPQDADIRQHYEEFQRSSGEPVERRNHEK
jgi:Flp pilus assembly protein TadD